jgi:hypothetical protein
MKVNGFQQLIDPFSSTALSAQGIALPLPAADIKSPHYARARQQRLSERLRNAGDQAAAHWNHLITIVVCGSDDDDIAALPRTLGSLLAQRYRNVEVLVVGKLNIHLSDIGDFTSFRGLFAEPGVDATDILSDPAADALWRGSHLILAEPGTEFDPDAVELLNAALDTLPDATAPALVLCDDQLPADDTSVCPLPDVPDRHADVMQSLDKCGAAVMVSRTLLQLARRPQQRPTSLRDWLREIATMTPAPHIVHIAETLIHIPPEAPLSPRSAPGVAP